MHDSFRSLPLVINKNFWNQKKNEPKWADVKKDGDGRKEGLIKREFFYNLWWGKERKRERKKERGERMQERTSETWREVCPTFRPFICIVRGKSCYCDWDNAWCNTIFQYNNKSNNVLFIYSFIIIILRRMNLSSQKYVYNWLLVSIQ